MTTDAFTPHREVPRSVPRSVSRSVSRAARLLALVSGWFAALAASFRWALEMRRRCERARLEGRQLDHQTLRRLAGETDAWVARR